MSSIGMIDPVTDYDEFGLIRVCGGHGGNIVDCDLETIMAVHEKDMEAAEKAFPLIIKMYQAGREAGERSGRYYAQEAMRQSLGIDDIPYRVSRLEGNVFPCDRQ